MVMSYSAECSIQGACSHHTNEQVERETAIAEAEKENEEEVALKRQKEARERALEQDRQDRRQHLNAWKVFINAATAVFPPPSTCF